MNTDAVFKVYSKSCTQNWDAIVIGSGMGGMACAAALAKYGRKVLVLEQHYVPGGFTHTFSRKGYTWDVGVHCVGQMKDYEIPGKLIKWLSDGRIKMISMGPTYETFHYPDNFTIRFPDSREGFRAILYEKFPDDKNAIDQYFELIKTVDRSAKTFFASKVLPLWIDKLSSRLLPSKLKWWSITTQEVLDQLTKNERLKSILTSQWGYYGSTPRHSSFAIHALTVRHFWNGGYYPEGGAQVFAETFLDVVQRAGGETLVRANVDEIIIENGIAKGVRMKTGDVLLAPLIISAAGAKATAQSLLPTNLCQHPWATEIDTIPQSPPHICLYLGFEGDIVSVGATKSNQWFMETWDMEDPVWDVRNLKSTAPILYMSFPSLKDPKHETGPNARHTGEVVTFVPWDAFEKWKHTRRGMRDPEYLAFKKDIETRLVTQLQKHIPQLMAQAKYWELSTPLSTVHFTRAVQGAIYGLEATPKRFLSQCLRTRTPFKNLYLAGGDVATLGVTGALVGGILAAGTIEPRILTKLI